MLTQAPRKPLAHRVKTTLAALAVAGMLALSVPTAAIAAPVSAPAAAPRAIGGPVRAAVTDPQQIVVNVGAVRGTGGVGDLAGVTLELRESSASSPDAPGAAVGQPWSTCVSLADGTCTFTVPNAGTGPSNTKGENNGKRFWVVQVSAPTDYYLNPTLITGKNTNVGDDRFAKTPYVYRTPALTGSGTITLPSATGLPSQSTVGAPLNSTTTSTTSRWITGGIVPVSQANNRFQTTCTPGLTVAILFDLSTSMSTNDNEGLNGAKTAGKALVDALVGTGAQVALYTFGTNAPKNNTATGKNYPTLTTVTSSSATTLKGYIDGYTASDINYTNWDRGLWQLAQATDDFDIAVVLTDGNPTVYGSFVPSGNDIWTYNRHVEEAIFSANALKDKGTQILTFGVGEGISAVSGDNLRAVAGTAEWTGTGSIVNYDYAKTNDWALVSSQLKALAAGITCKVPITVTKTEELLGGATQPGVGWTFTTSETGAGTLTGSASQATNSSGQASWSVDFAAPTDTSSVTITETIKNSGWQLKSVVCTNNGDPFYSGTSATFTLPDLELGDNIACAVTNQQIQASVVVNKTWVVNGTSYANGAQLPTSLSAQLVLGGSSQAFGTARGDLTVGSTTTIKETVSGVPALCTVTGQRLTGPGAADVSLASGATFTTPTLPAGLTTYELTNTVTCTSELTLVKDVTNDDGGDAVPGDWELSYNGTPVSSGTTVTVTPGAYELTESEVVGYAPRATTPLVCSEGLSGVTVTVPLATHVTCTFYNDDIAPTLSLQKIVVGADGVAPTNWTLTAKDGATTVLTGSGSVAATEVRANTPYTLAETSNGFAGASDFEASAWECQTNGTGPWVSLAASGVLPGIGVGDDVACRITNTPEGADPTITKTVDSPAQNADGTWTITYLVTVTNPNQYAGLTYDLADTLAFGGTITTSATASGPSAQAATWNGAGNTVLADDTALAAGSSHEYTIVAIASVPNGAPNSVITCPTGSGAGGFLNRAVLTVDGTDYPAQACTSPVTPTFVKSPGTATSNADGTWTLTYTLTATNGASIPVFYDLVDNPQATFPPGVEVVSGSVSPAGTWNPLSQTVVADDAVLAANSSTTYTISVVVRVAPDVTATTLTCGAQGTGLVNSATLTSGNQVITDDACLSVTPPVIVHDKTVTSTAQNADGTWTIVYDIVVKNTGSVSGLYNLSDELKVGVTDAIAVVSASASGVASWNGTSDQVLATSRAIAPGEANWQHYTITVVASVAAGVTGTAPALCESENGTNGFLNTTTITVGGVDTEDSACSSPTKPSFTKSLAEVAPAGANTWNVSYVLTVDNSTVGAQDVYYTLGDVPGFSSELAITGYAVTETSADPEVDLAWNGGSLVPAPRLIEGGAVDTFEVVITVIVPAGVDTDVLECTDTKEPGYGLQNTAAIQVGTDVITSVACGDVEESAVPRVAKSVVPGFPTQLADGTWEIQYDITVSSDSTLDATYSLSDTLAYGAGIVVNSASIQSTDATPAVDWNGDDATTVVTDEVLPGGDQHVFRVTVNASVPRSSFDTGSTVCDPGLVTDGGFLNTATLTAGKTEPQTVADCASPAQPTITKVLDPTTPPAWQEDGSYLVTYLVTVSNDSALQLSYDLDDSLGFPNGVTLSQQQATDPDGATINGWDGLVDTRLADDTLIAAGDDHVYTITVRATPTASLDLDDVDCTTEPSNGLFNGALLVSGGIDQDASACTELPVAELTLVKEVNNSAFEGLDLNGATLPTASDWVLVADGPVLVAGTTGTADVTTVLVPAGDYDLLEDIDLTVSNPLMPYYTAGDWTCEGGDLDVARLALDSGNSATCTIVNTGSPVDLTIDKSDGGEIPTDEGSSYEYSFVITNQGEIDATGVVVTDEIPATLAVDMATIGLPTAWGASLDGADADGFGGTLTLVKTGVFAVGEVATVTVTVRVADTLPRADDDPTGVILDIVNTAIVDSDGVEQTPEDNTSTEETPVKSLAVEVQVVCELNAPYADWSITPQNTTGVADAPVALIWWSAEAFAGRDTSIPASDTAAILADGASQVDLLPTPTGGWVSGVTVTGSQLWPGAAVDTKTGIGTAWPGWVINDEGEWALDPTAPFYEVHAGAILEIRMNPSTATTEAYPPANLGCFPKDPPTLPEPPEPPVPPVTPPVIPLLASTGLNLVGGAIVGLALLGVGAASRIRRKAH